MMARPCQGRAQQGKRSGRLRLLAAALLASGAAGACHRDPVLPCPVFSPVGFIVSPSSRAVPLGDTASFRVMLVGGGGYSCGGRTYPPLPRGATWSISNGGIASIAASTDTSVVVAGIGVGSASVIATSVWDPTMKAAGMLTVQCLVGQSCTSSNP